MEHQGGDKATGRQVLSWALLDVVLVVIGAVASAGQLEFAPGSLSLLVVAVVLEATALRLPEGMFYSFSAAPVLGLGLHPRVASWRYSPPCWRLSLALCERVAGPRWRSTRSHCCYRSRC